MFTATIWAMIANDLELIKSFMANNHSSINKHSNKTFWIYLFFYLFPFITPLVTVINSSLIYIIGPLISAESYICSSLRVRIYFLLGWDVSVSLILASCGQSFLERLLWRILPHWFNPFLWFWQVLKSCFFIWKRLHFSILWYRHDDFYLCYKGSTNCLVT